MTEAAKLLKARETIVRQRKELRRARHLLTRAADEIPNRTDGANDRLLTAIELWLQKKGDAHMT